MTRLETEGNENHDVLESLRKKKLWLIKLTQMGDSQFLKKTINLTLYFIFLIFEEFGMGWDERHDRGSPSFRYHEVKVQVTRRPLLVRSVNNGLRSKCDMLAFEMNLVGQSNNSNHNECQINGPGKMTFLLLWRRGGETFILDGYKREEVEKEP